MTRTHVILYLLGGIATLGYSINQASNGQAPWAGFGNPGPVLGMLETVALWPIAAVQMATS